MATREAILAYHLAQQHYVFGSGHVCCRPGLVAAFRQQWDFITLLRNPLDRWVSQFTYDTYKAGTDWARNTLPLGDYIHSPKAKITALYLLRFFSDGSVDPVSAEPVADQAMNRAIDHVIDQAVDNILSFRLVGTLERIDDWCAGFREIYGVELTIPAENTSPNAAVKDKLRSDPELMERVQDLCAPDIVIYDRMAAALADGRVSR